MLQRKLFKFKACVSKALGCLYHCFRQKGQLLGDRRNIWGRERGGDRSRENERERMRRESRARETEGERGRQRRREWGRQGKKRRRGHDCTLSTAFCGPLCRCHQLFPCTEGSRAWNIASGPRPRPPFKCQSDRMGWGVGDWGVEDQLREAGERGDFGGTKAKGANRLGFGHCPENSASDSPLI